MTTRPQVKLVSTTQAAEILGVSRTMIFRHVRAGHIRPLQTFGKWHAFAEADILQFKEWWEQNKTHECRSWPRPKKAKKSSKSR